MTEKELKPLVGKPCRPHDGILEIRKCSDATIKAVENGEVILEHIFGHVISVPISEIRFIIRKDLLEESLEALRKS